MRICLEGQQREEEVRLIYSRAPPASEEMMFWLSSSCQTKRTLSPASSRKYLSQYRLGHRGVAPRVAANTLSEISSRSFLELISRKLSQKRRPHICGYISQRGKLLCRKAAISKALKPGAPEDSRHLAKKSLPLGDEDTYRETRRGNSLLEGKLISKEELFASFMTLKEERRKSDILACGTISC